MQLKIISEERIKDSGKCKSCQYNLVWQEHGIWESDCSHELFEKLLSFLKNEEEIEYGDEIGFNKICPLWQPRNVELCEKHGLYFENDGCQICEHESIIEAENFAKVS